MDNNLTLVVMAAGMGSRFKGLKQVEPIGPNNEFLIDYSIYDAIKAGFKKVVFIIKEENLEIFRETIGKRIEDKIEVCYAFQKMEDVPSGYEVPKTRVKPLGTGQAILAAEKYVDSNFAVINADDFYGRDAIMVAAQFLKENKEDDTYALVAYKVINTLTENGSVKRGICYAKDGYLDSLIESKVEKNDNQIVAERLYSNEKFVIDCDTSVSLNLFCFKKSIFKYLKEGFVRFFDNNKDDLEEKEYLLPVLVEEEVKRKNIKVKVLQTTSVWYGMTYKEDKDSVVASIDNLIKEGVYPSNLWEK